MSTINLDGRGRPWAERKMQDAVERGAAFDLDGLKGLLRQHLEIPPSHHIVLTASHEEALSTAVSGVVEGCGSAAWDRAAPAAMRAAVKALQRHSMTATRLGWTDKTAADLVALQWWNEETLHEHPIEVDARSRLVIDAGAALCLGHLPDWSRPNAIWTIPGWSLCGPVASGWVIKPADMGFIPTIHGTGQDPMRGGSVDPLLIWRVAGGLIHRSQAADGQDDRIAALEELVERLEVSGAKRLTRTDGPGAVLHWPRIAAIGIAHACEARGLHIAAADACLATKTEGSVGWTALGRPEVAHEAVLLTADEEFTSEMIERAAATIDAAAEELRHLGS